MSCAGDDYSPPEVVFEGLYRGDDAVLPFLAEVPSPLDADPSDPDTMWVPRDLAGGDWVCQFRWGSPTGTVSHSATVDTTLASVGQFNVGLPSSWTETVFPGVRYYFDVERTTSERETLVRGYVTFTQDVTQ